MKKIVILIIVIIFFGCSKNVRNVSETATINENEGILYFVIDHRFAPMLMTLNIDIYGYDISKPNVPEMSRIWVHNKIATIREYKYIVPAGRYRIENVTSISDDQTISQGHSQNIELEYKPRFSFYVVKGKVNFLGIISLHRTENKNDVGAFPMQSGQRNLETYYVISQKFDLNYFGNFRNKYNNLLKQTSGFIFQNFQFKPWNRQYSASDPLKRSPAFENGYQRVQWYDKRDDAMSVLLNFYANNAKLETISNFRFIDHTKTGEIAIYDFNNIQGIQYQNGGLYKVTVIQGGKFEETFEKMKLLYGLYNKEGDKIIWRLVNSMITLEKLDDNFVRITRVSMEYIRKVATLKPTEIGTIQPTETTLRPAIAQPTAAPATVPNRTEENTQPSGQ